MQRQLLSVLFFVVSLAEVAVTIDSECTPPLFFKCQNTSKCISHVFVCDGEDDCGDASDEERDQCLKELPSLADECKEHEFQCADRFHCIPADEYCDGKKDCLDGSDEVEDCHQNITCSGYKCLSGQCILQSWVCDGTRDCRDSSDEINCDMKQAIAPANCNNTIDKYLCVNHRCIDLGLVCDNIDNCGDYSDENPAECKKAQESCKSSPCSSECRPTPKGYKCACSTGYIYKNHACRDVDECEEWGLCDQKCINNLGSYYCECEIGYKLQDDKHSCKSDNGEALMIFATKTSIRGYYLESAVYFSIAENLQHVVGVSLDANYIYWSDIQLGEETIFRSLDDGSEREVIVTAGLGCPEDIAVDWVTGNIYFTDSIYKHIGVCNDNGNYCTVLVNEDTDKPRGIVVMPSRSKMYWSDWGNNPHIAVSFMDGSKKEYFIKDKLGWPNGLTIDYPSERLYWVDAKLKVIESIHLDGVDRRTILHDVTKHPYSIAIFGNRLYWSDWSTNSIHSCNKFTGKNFITLVQKNETIYGIHIYHSTFNVKYANPCVSKPCSQLCLMSENQTYTCACTMDKELGVDRHTCRDTGKRKQVAIAAGSTIGNYYHELLGRPRVTSSVTADHVNVITYDPLRGTRTSPKDENDEGLILFASKKSIRGYNLNSTLHFSLVDDLDNVVGLTGNSKYIFWTDIQPGKEAIHRSLANGTRREAIVTSGLGCPEDIAVDWITGNFYFTDSAYKRIGACDENGFYCTVVIDDDMQKPRGIALLPPKGTMYWSDWGKNPRISTANMDGSNVNIFIQEDIHWPNGLTIDYSNEHLYWVDAKLKTIQSIQLDGQDRRTIFHNAAIHPYSIATFGNRLYWSDWSTNSIQFCNKFNGESVNTLLQANETLLGVHVDHSTLNVKGKNHCATNPCSDLCLLTENGGYSCACPLDKELNSDRRTCRYKEGQKYLSIAIGNTIINYYQKLLGRPRTTFSVMTEDQEDHISALTYDPVTVTFIAGGGHAKELYRYNAYSGDFNDIRPIAKEVDGCIAFDYLGGNLYKSSATSKAIQVQSLDTDTQVEFSYEERPYDLILIPEEGAMFVVFQSESNHTTYHITRLPMDGVSGEAYIVEKNLKGPKISLAYDENDDRVFWADEDTGSIWSVDSRGQDKKLLRGNITSPVNIAVFDNDIFWTSRGSSLLSWTDKKGLSPKVKSVNLPTQRQGEIPILLVIGGNRTNFTHPCRVNNGNCSHVCLVTDLNKALCVCPSDLIIDADEKSCRVKGLCADDEIKCSKNDKCINKNQRCDGVKDCEDGEDEMRCKKSLFPTKFSEFTYHKGKLFIRTDNATVYELDGEA